jgi:ribonuclease HI
MLRQQSQHHTPPLPRDFTILWANVRRSSASHNTTLSLAEEQKFDIVCVQEPWTSPRTMTQTHPAYHLYAPIDAWDWDEVDQSEAVRPKVLTYVRKTVDIQVQQSRPLNSRDLLWLNVNGFSVLNVYRQPNNDSILEYIIDLDIPDKCIIGGDFNVHHDLFEPGVTTFGRGGDLAQWSTDSMMDFTGEAGVPTHDAGHVLDLVFSNILFTRTTVRPELHTGSDHATLATTIPGYGDAPARAPTYRVTEKNLARFTELIDAGFQKLPNPNYINSTQGLDSFAFAIEEIFRIAIEKGGTLDKGTGKSAAWWTDACRQAHLAYTFARQNTGDCTIEKKAFIKEVRQAKRECWRHIIDQASDDKSLYKVVSWHKQAPKLKAPPLKIGDRIVEDTLQKAEVLRKEVLGRFSAEDDLPDFDPRDFDADMYAGLTSLPWELHVSLEEVERCTIGVTSTSPGTDKVTVRLLKACWYAIKNKLHSLFEKCLQLSHFPTCWKGAEVAMIPKVGPGKDPASVRSWRPIALLSCISKGFERILAKRFTWTALTHNILSKQHAGALPKRSAMDLVASLTHDLEAALQQKKVATLVTLDVQGAFDALMPNRLLRRMQSQGWPISAICLVRSFLVGRRVRVRLEDRTTIFYDVDCGTPQGSPLSPVIYMLYLAELLQQDNRLRFGYADDIALYRTSNSLDRNIELLQRDVEGIITWGEENKIFFAPEKMEMIHIHSGRTTNAPVLEVREGMTITPITTAPKANQQPALRWLGMWFDRKLRFRRHVSERTAKARRVAQHIRNLARTKDGPPASSLRKAVVTCVLSSALYGAEAWYAGRLQPSKTGPRGTMSSTRVGGHLKLVQSAITLAARGVLPVWKTTPIAALLRDSGLPSAEVALEESRARFALRTQTVDRDHPLACRIDTMTPSRVNARARSTRLQRSARLVPEAPRPALRSPHYTAGCRTDPTLHMDKEEAAIEFKRWQKQLPPSDVLIFSDGSEQWKDGTHIVGYGYAIYQNGKKLADGMGTIHELSHVFDAEAIGAWKGLQAALRSPTLRGNRFWMCIDSTSVIWCLRGNASDSSQWAFHNCQDAFLTAEVRVKWSPGHTGIEGNEEADTLANFAANPDRPWPCTDPLSHRPTICGIRSIAREITRTATQAWWESVTPKLSQRYARWGLSYALKPPPELSLPRTTLHHLLALRTGHGDFSWYHTRFNHMDALLDCSCGELKTPEHLVFCKRIFRYLYNWPLKPKRPPRDENEDLSYLKDLMAEPQRFLDFTQLTNFYSKVCTR